MTLGNRIKKLRQMAGLTQEQLAKAIGYETKTSISKIENDKLDLNQSTVVALARALKTTPSVIMGWSEIEEQTEADYLLSNSANQSQSLTAAENQLLEDFRVLDKDGQAKLIALADDLAQLERLKKHNTPAAKSKDA